MAIPLALLFRWKMCCTTLTTISPPFLFFPSPIPTIFPSVSYLLHLREGGISSKFKKRGISCTWKGREGKGRVFPHERARERLPRNSDLCIVAPGNATPSKGKMRSFARWGRENIILLTRTASQSCLLAGLTAVLCYYVFLYVTSIIIVELTKTIVEWKYFITCKF